MIELNHSDTEITEIKTKKLRVLCVSVVNFGK